MDQEYKENCCHDDEIIFFDVDHEDEDDDELTTTASPLTQEELEESRHHHQDDEELIQMVDGLIHELQVEIEQQQQQQQQQQPKHSNEPISNLNTTTTTTTIIISSIPDEEQGTYPSQKDVEPAPKDRSYLVKEEQLQQQQQDQTHYLDAKVGKMIANSQHDVFARDRLITFLNDDLGIKGDEITKSKLHKLLLEEAGVWVTDQVLESIFLAADKDGSGLISDEEFCDYIMTMRPSKAMDRTKYVIRGMLCYLPTYLACFNLAASLISAQTNLRERQGENLYGVQHHWWMLASVFDFFGNFGYVFLSYQEKVATYERLKLAQSRLARWVKSELPKHSAKRVRSDLYSPETTHNMSLSAEMSLVWEGGEMESANSFSLERPVNKLLNSNEGMDIDDLRCLLEQSGVFLPGGSLQEIFNAIDEDKSGNITLLEIERYAAKERQNPSSILYVLEILKRCCQDVGWWGSWLFVIGATFWICVAYVHTSNYVLLLHLVGMTCANYLFAAVTLLFSAYGQSESSVAMFEIAEARLREIAISLANHRHELEQVPEVKPSSDLRYSRKLRQSIFSDTIRKSQTKLHVSAHEKDLQSEGARILFALTDVDMSGTISTSEFAETLVNLGVLLPTHTFTRLFQRIDASGDGEIQVEEFIEYIGGLRTKSPFERRFETLSHMMGELTFYLVLVKICAGSAQTFAAYNKLGNPILSKNFFLVGSCCWAVGSLYLLNVIPSAQGKFFDLLESTKFQLREALLRESAGKSALPDERI